MTADTDRTVPLATGAEPRVIDLLGSFRLHLQAENKAPRTIASASPTAHGPCQRRGPDGHRLSLRGRRAATPRRAVKKVPYEI